jgi:hypothetical protein
MSGFILVIVLDRLDLQVFRGLHAQLTDTAAGLCCSR